jgi:hypothetical protein
MRALLILWAMPLGFFWGWYFLSLNDVNFGTLFFSRAMHDAIMQIYAGILKTDAASVPGILAKTFAIDTVLLGGIVAFRRRVQIKTWWNSRRQVTEIIQPRASDAEAPIA